MGSKSVAITSSERDSLVSLSKSLIRRINTKDYNNCINLFDDNLKKVFSEEKMGQIFGIALDTLGPFQRFGSAVVTKKKGDGILHTSCTVKCDYKNGPATYTVIFDDARKISGIHLD